MDVILLERVEKLGAIGDVVKVKDGFARNYLLPNKKALRANDANKKVFEANRSRIESDNANRRGEAEKDAKNYENASVTLIRQASNTGQLYGSVAVRDLIEVLEAEGHKILKSQIVLNKPIKAIGLYEVNVARSPEEAEMQASGVDVMAAMFEKDEAGFTEDYDPNAEPGATAEVSVVAEAPEAGEASEG